MSKMTFAQLPGLQKAAQNLKQQEEIQQLQEQINTHHRYATWLLRVFNTLHEQHNQFAERMAHMWPDDVKPTTSFFTEYADHVQIICEWHGTQAMYLQCQLDKLNSTR